MTFLSIQYLRAIAALMVVIVHLYPQWERMGYTGDFATWLFGGVDIFFVISGFIMWQTTQGRGQSPATFYQRRVVRIVPLYWLLTSVVVAAMLLSPHLLQSARYDLWHVVSSYLFIPSVNPGNGHLEPVLIPGWTLNYEMFFYLLFGVSLWLPENIRLIILTCIFSLVVALQATNPAPGTLLSFYSSSIILEFLFGMVLCHFLLQKKPKIPVYASWMLIVVGCALLVGLSSAGLPWPRVVVLGVPALLIVAGALTIEYRKKIPRWGFLLLLGNSSYSLYLSHALTLSAVSQLWRRMNLQSYSWSIAAFSITAIILSIVVGIVVYAGVERHLTHYLSGKRGKQLNPGGF